MSMKQYLNMTGLLPGSWEGYFPQAKSFAAPSSSEKCTPRKVGKKGSVRSVGILFILEIWFDPPAPKYFALSAALEHEEHIQKKKWKKVRIQSYLEVIKWK